MNIFKKEYKNKFLNFLILCFSVLVILFLLELFLIFDDYYKKFQNPYEAKINNVNYKINFNKKKLNQKRNKIFVVGDSFIQGDFCAFDKKTLPDEIQKINDNYSVINVGLGGKSLPNYIDILTNELIPQKNDKVILFLYDNDIFISKEMCNLSAIHNRKFGIYKPKTCKDIINNKIKEKS